MSVFYSVNFNDSSLPQIHRPSYSNLPKSQQSLKHELISKIKALAAKNTQLEVRQESLQNTIYDLRKLIELTNKESQQMLLHLHKKIKKMEAKIEGYNAGLFYAQKNDAHLQKCMLFWNQFM